MADDGKFKKGCTKIGGRKKGTPNRSTAMVKTALLTAFDELGGAAYLVEVGRTEPKAFLTLLAKIVPAELRTELSVSPGNRLVEYMEAANKRVDELRVPPSPGIIDG